jgi:hypothetical protein
MRETTSETCADRIRFSLSDASGKLAFGGDGGRGAGRGQGGGKGRGRAAS